MENVICGATSIEIATRWTEMTEFASANESETWTEIWI